MAETVSPHSLEAERALIGGVLVDPDRLFDAVDVVTSRDFFRTAHAILFETIVELSTQQETIDPLTVTERLKRKAKLDDVGGPAIVYGLTDGVPRSTNVLGYAQIVRGLADKRRLIHAANKILTDAHQADAEARDLIDSAERRIFELSTTHGGGDFIDGPQLATEGYKAIEVMLEQKQGVSGVATGFIDFDEMTRGLQPSTLIILAARPSMGKTSLALNLAFHAAEKGEHTAFFSLEMSKEELFIRLVASVARIDAHRLQSGYINQTDYGRLSHAIGQISESAIHVDESPILTLMDVRGKSRRLKAKHGLSLVVVDYLQLMEEPSAENRNLAIAAISKGLKQIARELKVPVVALSQLSRDTEKRGDKKPMLSDLRDSGALEQDADLVVFIHREEVYTPRPDNAGLAELIIAKQRTGPTGTVKLRWSREQTRFDNLAS